MIPQNQKELLKLFLEAKSSSKPLCLFVENCGSCSRITHLDLSKMSSPECTETVYKFLMHKMIEGKLDAKE